MTITLWILLLLLAPQAKPGTISGRVVLADESTPLVDEPIGIWPLGAVIRTGANGSFEFRGLSNGTTYTLIVIHDRIKAAVDVRAPAEGVYVAVNAAPAITGTVFDPFGHRLASARVDAFRMAYRPIGAHLRF